MRRVEMKRLGITYLEKALSNGMTVRVVPKPGFFRKYAFCAVDYGSIDTTFCLNGKTVHTPDGVAHYLEHKMFDLPDGNAMDRFAATGASPNAFTSYDMTAYYFSCTDAFEENLKTLLEMVSVPYFTEESVEKERGIIAQEIRMYADSPDSRLYEDLFASMFQRHPVRVPIAGTVQSVGEITAETLQACFSAFYTPANMILCVVGDVEPERVIAQAETCLPKVCRPVPARAYRELVMLDRAPAEVRRGMEVAMPMFSLGFRCKTPEPGRANMKQEIIGDLASELLAGESSPLYQRLYEQNQIDSAFSGGFECVKGASLFSFSGDSPEPDAIREQILQECARLLQQRDAASAIQRLKKSAMGRRIRELDSFESICYRVCSNFFDGVDYFIFPELYEEVTEQDIWDFLADTVKPSRMAYAVIEPKGESKKC